MSSKKILLFLALLPLTRFGFPTRDGQTIELEDNESTKEMVDLGYIKLVEDVDETAVANIEVNTNANADAVDAKANTVDAKANANADDANAKK